MLNPYHAKYFAHDLTRSQHVSKALAWVFEKPVFQGVEFVRSSGIPKPTAHRFLGVHREAKEVLLCLTFYKKVRHQSACRQHVRHNAFETRDGERTHAKTLIPAAERHAEESAGAPARVAAPDAVHRR